MKLAVAILAAFLCGGCFIWEEIEQGRSIMEAHSPDSDGEEEAADALAGAQSSPKTARERLAEYYAKQRAKASGPTQSLNPADDLGRCRIGNTTQFTRRSDCSLRGGTFL
jgi:hypothetical protein